MKFPSGYEINKGPYVTNHTRVNGTTARSIGAEGQDILIWSIYCRNHGNSESRYFSIYDNYATTRTAAQDSDFEIFRQHLSPNKKAITGFNFNLPVSPWIDTSGAGVALTSGSITVDMNPSTVSLGIGPFSYDVWYAVDPEFTITWPTATVTWPTFVTQNYDFGQDLAGAMPSANWQFETPILARNGAYLVGTADVDATVLWSYAGTSTPYDNANSPTTSSKQIRADIKPELVATRGSYLPTADNNGKTISECDCEIWGYSTYNTTASEKMLRLIDGDSNNIMDVWVGPGWTAGSGSTADNESVQGFIGTVPPTLFKTPIYAKGGFSAWNLTASTSSPANTTGLNSNFIYRELKTNKSLGVTGVR